MDVSTNPNGQGLTIQYAYDADDNLESVTDANGNVIHYRYDEQGNLTQRQDSAGNTASYTYSSSNQVLTETVYLTPDPDGLDPDNTGASAQGPSDGVTTYYVYDDPTDLNDEDANANEQHLRFVISPEGRVSEYRYNAQGQRIATIAYTQDRFDLSAYSTLTAPSETQVYDWLNDVSNPIDKTQTQRSDSAYTFRGQVDRVTSYTAVDAQGNGILDGTEAITQFVYDEHGNLLQTIDPRGTATATDSTDYVTAYTYDGLGRVLTTSQWVDSSTTVTSTSSYDDAGNRMTTTLANGLATTSVYDARGLLASQSQADTTQALGSTSYHYDAEGKLRYTIDPVGNDSYLLYDAADRPVMAIDATGSVAETVYDANGNVIQTIAYAAALNSTTLASLIDANGDPVVTTDSLIASLRNEASSSADRVAYTLYDKTNRPVMSLTPLDDDATQVQVTQSFYDGAGRLTDTVAYATPIALSSLPANPIPDDVEPLLTPSADDRHSRLFYDDDGNPLATLDAEGYLTQYRYDAAGRDAARVAFANRVTDPAIHASGSLAELQQAKGGADPNDRTSRTFYNAKGQVIGQLDADGYLTIYEYDLAGNQTHSTRYATVTGLFDVNGNLDQAATVTLRSTGTLAQLRPAASNNDRVSVTSYTALNQIQTVTSTDGTVTQYTYDDVGNLIQSDTAVNTTELRTTQARYDSRGNVIGELTGEGSAALAVWLIANPSATPAEIEAQTDLVWNDYGLTHSYDLNNRRISTTDQNGNTSWFYYDSNNRLTVTIHSADGTVVPDGTVLSNVGEISEVVYNAFGQIEQTVQYSQRIDTTTLTGGALDTALRTQLDTLRDTSASSQDRVTQVNYTLRGNVSSAIDAEGGWTINNYTVFGEVRQQKRLIEDAPIRLVTDTYVYNKRSQLIQSTADSGGLARITQTQYDAFGRITHTTDGNGQETAFDYSYDSVGRAITTSTDALNQNTVIAYDAFGRTLTVRDALGQVIQFTYDDVNRSVTITTPELIETTTLSNRHGETVSITDGNGIVTAYAYDNNGNLITVTEAKGTAEETITSTNTYDNANRTLTTENANGTVTQFSYDAANRLMTRTVDPQDPITNPEGLNLTTQYRYDALGNTIQSIDVNGTVTQTEYDNNGQVTAMIVDPYDATTNPDGLHLKTTYTYDAQGQTLSVTEGITRNTDGTDNLTEARTTDYRYDNLGRRTHTIVDPYHATTNPNGLHIITQYVYDKNDNLIQSIEGITRNTDGTDNLTDARTTRYAYDNTNQLRYTVDAVGGVTEGIYDVNGNTVKTVVYATALSEAEITAIDGASDREGALTNLFENLADATQDRTTWYAYDAAGRLRYSVDALGHVTETVYDANGNIRETLTHYDAIVVSSLSAAATADDIATALANRVSPQTQKDQHTQYDYDGANRLIQVTDAEGHSEYYGYDAIGNKTAFTNKKGDYLGDPAYTWTYRYDAVGRLIEEITPAVAVTRTSENSDGSVSTTTVQGGLLTRMSYDALGNVVTRTEGTLILADGTHDATEARTTTYVYDALGRQTQTIFPEVSVYDAIKDAEQNYVGRNEALKTLTSTTYFDALDQAYANQDMAGNFSYKVYDSLGRVAYEIDTERYVTGYTYDAFGNQLTLTRYATALDESLFTNGVDAREDVASATSIQGLNIVELEAALRVSDPDAVQVTNTSITESTTPNQPYPFVAGASLDTETASIDTVPITVTTAITNQSTDVINNAWVRSGTALVESTGVSITVDSSLYGDTTPTLVQASVYASDGSLYGTFTTDVGYYTPSGYVNVWTPVTNWSGQVNISNTVMPADTYTVNIDIRDEDTTHDAATWTRAATRSVTVGTLADTTLSWAASTAPAATSTTWAGYRAAGSTADYTELVLTDINGQHQLTLPTLEVGDYEIAVQYRDAYGTVIKHATTTVSATASGSVTVDTAFDFIDRTSTTGRGTSLGGFIDPAEQNSIDVIKATVYDGLTNAIVSFAETYPEAHANYDGEVNLKVGDPIADGNYRIAISVHYKDGRVVDHPRFDYQIGSEQTLRRTTTLAWSNTDQPVNTAAHFVYAPQGSATETAITPTLIGTTYQVALIDQAMGEYSYRIEYHDANQAIVQQRSGSFEVTEEPLLSATDRILSHSYDQLNRVIETQQPEVFSFDSSAPAGQQYFSASPTTRNTYNAFGQLTKQATLKNPLTNEWIATHYYYDSNGRQTAQIDALGHLTTYAYDASGNLIEQIEYAQALTYVEGTLTNSGTWNTDAYLEPALTTAATSAQVPDEGYDRVTRHGYDRLNQKTADQKVDVEVGQVAYGSGTPPDTQTQTVITRYTYDEVGNLTSVTDPTGATTYTYYDALGRTTALAEPARLSEEAGSVMTPTLVVTNRHLDADIASATFQTYSSGYTTLYEWKGANQIDVRWQSLEAWGDGSVRFRVDYYKKNGVGSTQAAVWQDTISAADGMEGVKLTWAPSANPSRYSMDGASHVARVQVWKTVNGAEVLVHDTNGDSNTQAALTWEKPPVQGTQVDLRYRVAGAAQWTVATVVDRGSVYWVDIAHLPSDQYEYAMTYTRPGDTAPYAQGTGTFNVTGQSAIGSQHVVGTIEKPFLDADIASATFQTYSSGYTTLYEWKGANQIDVRWQSLEAWGDGSVRFRVDYYKKNGVGSTQAAVWQDTISAADGMEGVKLTWAPSANPSRYSMDGASHVARVQVWKTVNGAEVLVHDTNGDIVQPERLILQGNTAGLTGIKVADESGNPVGSLNATLLAGELYVVDVSILAPGTYTYTPLGTASIRANSVTVYGNAVTTTPMVRENVAYVDADIASATFQTYSSGYTTLYEWKGANQIDVRWQSLEAWGDGSVRFRVDYYKKNGVGSTQAAVWQDTISAADGMEGVKLTWAPSANPSRYSMDGASHVARVQVWKTVNGAEVLVHDTNGDAYTPRLELSSLPATAESVTFEYRPLGDTGPYQPKTAQKIGSGWFTVNYDDIPNGQYEYVLTVTDVNGSPIDLTTMGGNSDGTIGSTIEIKRGGQAYSDRLELTYLPGTAESVTLELKPQGSSEPYQAIPGSKIQAGWFAIDYTALATGVYDYRLTVLDANGQAVDMSGFNGDVNGIIQGTIDIRGGGGSQPNLEAGNLKVLTPLTTFSHDRYGNVVHEQRYAEGTQKATLSGYSAPIADANNDAYSYTFYDRFGRAITTIDAEGNRFHASYDVNGNVRKQWYTQTDPDGRSQQVATLFEYDRLGQQLATSNVSDATPASIPATLIVTNRHLDADIASATFQTYSSGYTTLYEWKGANQIDVRWQSLEAWGDGSVRFRVDYYKKNGVGSTQAAVWQDTISAADGMEGVKLTWAPSANPSRYSMDGASHVARVQVWKTVNGAEVLVHDTNGDSNTQAALTWEKPPVQGTQVDLRYRVAGAAQWTVATVVDRGSVYWVDIAHLPSDQYEYAMTYTRPGDTAPYAQGTGTFNVTGQSAIGSQHVVGTIEKPFLDADIASATFQTYSSGYTTLYEWKGANQIDVRWQSLEAWGDGSVRFRVDYYKKNGVGSTQAAVWQDTISAADGMEGVKLTWAPSANPSRYSMDGASHVARVQVWKTVNGAEVLVHDTNGDIVQPERLILQGNTAGLTGIKVADESGNPVGSLNATLLAGELYVVDVSILAPGTYTYTPLGTASIRANSVTVYGNAVTTTPMVRENVAYVDADIASATFQTYSSGYTTLYEWKGANQIDVRWQSLEAWGDGSVRFRVDYYKKNGVGSTQAAVWQDTISAADGMEGVKLTWAPSANPSRYSMDGASHVARVQVWKTVNGAEVLVHDTNGDAYTPRLELSSLPATAESVTFEYRPLGDTGPYQPKTAQKIGSGWFTVNYDDIPNGQYEYVLTVTDVNGSPIDLTTMGGNSDGTIGSTIEIKRGGQDLVTAPDVVATLDRFESRYNAFGEITAKGLNGNWHEYYDYDAAGHLWRTNQGDGVDKIALYNLQGRATADIRSASRDLSDTLYSSPQNVTNLSYTQRTDSYYDALGRLTQQVRPGTTTDKTIDGIPATLIVTNRHLDADIASATFQTYSSGYTTLYEWKGANQIDVRWQSLEAWGDGSVRFRVDYYKKNGVGSTQAAVWQDTISAADGMEGVKLTWAPSANPSRYSMDGASHVARVQVWKTVNGAEVLVHDTNGDSNTQAALTWEKPPVQGTQVDLRYRVAGAAQWTVATVVDRGSVYWVDIAHLPSDQYEYAMTYTRPGDTAPYAQGTGTFNVTGQSAIGSQHVVGTIEKPFLDADIASATFQTYSSGYTTLYEWKGANQIDVRWQSLEAWGDGSVRFRVDYYKKNGVGSTQAAVWQDTISAADGMEGVKLTWAPSANPSRYSMDGASHVARVQVWKTVNGAEVLVHDTNGDIVQPERLILQGNTAGLTGIKVADESGNPVGSLNATLLAGELYVVDVSILAPGTYTYTPLGTASIRANSVTVYGNAVTTTPMVRENVAYVDADIASATFQTYSSGYTTLYEWKGANQIDVRWQSLEAWGDGSVRFRVDYYKKNGVGSTQAAVWQDTISAADGMEGVKLTWAPSANPSRYSMDGASHVARVQVWKTVNGAEVLVHDTNGDAYTPRLELSSLPATAESVTFEYRPLGDTGPYQPKTAQKIGSGWFTVNYDDIPNGQYEYVLTVTDVNGSPIDLTTMGGNSDGTIGSTIEIKRGGQDLVTAPDVVLETTQPILTQSLDRWGNVLAINDPRGGSGAFVDNPLVTEYRYNYLNQVIQQTQPEVAIWGTNGVNRLTDGVANDRPTTQYYYDAAGRQIASVDPNGSINAQRYDEAGQQVASYQADGGVVKFIFDALGNQVGKIDANGNQFAYTYDRNGHLLREQELIGFTDYTYDETGNRLTVTNGEGETTRNYYDTRGNLILTRRPGDGPVQGQLAYQPQAKYDAMGHKIYSLNANWDVQTWTYDAFGRLEAKTDLAGETTSYTYNYLGQLATQTSSRGQALRHSYYENGMLKAIYDDTQQTETLYAYDASGHRIRERFMDRTTGNVYQDVQITYDALGRVESVKDNRYSMSYAYDANGNRRNTKSIYYDNANQEQIQDYWYTYDVMNRITLSQGKLINNQIVITADSGSGETLVKGQGTELAYDAGGNRRFARTYDGTTLVEDSYVYDHNLLIETYREGKLTSQRNYDLAGRVKEYVSYSSPGVMKEKRVSTYNANGQLNTQVNYDANGAKSYTMHYEYPDSYDAVGNLMKYAMQVHQGSGYTNTYTYEYEKWDSYKEKTVWGASTYFLSGNSTSTYDINGNLLKVNDPNDAAKVRTFISNTQGQILQKHQDGMVQHYYYANNNPVGSVGELSDADFDYNYTPVSDQYPSSSPSSYVVNQGDTLQTVALAVYGDASLWYLIADTNGLNSSSALKAGQTLKVPNVVSNIHHNANTFKPYNPGEIIGDTTPTLPDPPPPPVDKSGGKCGGFLSFLVVIVAVVVAAVTQQWWLAEMGAKWAFLAPAVGAAAGSIAGQVIGVATGLQEEFDWGAVATAALTAGFTRGVDISQGPLMAAAQGAVNNMVGQGIGIITGQQEKFEWSQVIVSALAAPITASIDAEIKGVSNTTSVKGFSWSGFGADLGAGLAKGVVKQGVRILVDRKGKMDWSQIAVDAFGNAVGNGIVAELHQDARYNAQQQKIAQYRKLGIPFTTDRNGNPTIVPMKNGGLDPANGNPLNIALAKRFSELSYDLRDGPIDPKLLPEHWRELDSERYGYSELQDLVDQGMDELLTPQGAYRVFVNDTTGESVIAFKGSTPKLPAYARDWYDDVAHAGRETYKTIDIDVGATVSALRDNYQVFTAGHSLGGALAQSTALDYDLPGYAFDSLPVSSELLSDMAQSQGISSDQVLANYRSNNNFIVTNYGADIATAWFSNVWQGSYLDPTPTTVPGPFSNNQMLGLWAVGLGIGSWANIATGAVTAGLMHPLSAMDSRFNQGAIGNDGRIYVDEPYRSSPTWTVSEDGVPRFTR